MGPSVDNQEGWLWQKMCRESTNSRPWTEIKRWILKIKDAENVDRDSVGYHHILLSHL